MSRLARVAALVCASLVCPLAPGLAAAQDAAQTTLHLLDYIGVDYAGAVEKGQVKSADEYKEMQEFAAQAGERIRALPENPAKPLLIADSEKLAALVAAKADAQEVAEASSKLRWALAGAYRVQLAPRRAPDLSKAATLFAANCAACHGTEGRGDGPAAKGLDPPPSNFHDHSRMASRSVYGLYSTITLGVSGTSMAAFKQLGDEERWAVAFHAANLGTTAAQLREGEAAWKAGKAKSAFTDLSGITSLSAAEVGKRHGADAEQVLAYLRVNPQALAATKPAPIDFAREKLGDALAAYGRGDRIAARDLATTAYLEGFELVEASLDNVDPQLRRSIERDMLDLRGAIAAGAPPETLQAQVTRIDALLASASEKLSAGNLSPGAAFASALVILLREGLEAILLLAAIIAFVKKTGRTDALRYVHAGWILALALGFATWAIASYAIGISGANRELTEGVTALFAAAMLLYVGYWLHGKTQAQAWTSFLRETVGQALERRTLWAMVGVSFLAVYREIFEVVLFYEALWAQAGDAGQNAVLGGIACAVLLLAAAGWGIFRYSVRLPLGPFFSSMSLLLALLAVVFAGQGVAALQEAGLVSASRVGAFALPILGIHPTAETLGAQAAAIALVLLGTYFARRGASPEPARKS